MKRIERLNRAIMNSQGLEAAVKSYGANTISELGSAAIISIATAIGTGPAAFVAAPLVAGLVSFVNRLEYDYKEHDLLQFYRDQIAAAKGESNPDLIEPKDLRNFAAGRGEFKQYGPNPLLQEELENLRHELFRSIASHVIATGVFALTALAVLPVAGPVLSTLGIGAGALLVFDQMDRYIGAAAKLLFPDPNKTAQADMQGLQEALHRGDSVTPMLVYSVLVKTSPEATENIRKEYGVDFDALYLSQKHDSLLKNAEAMNIGAITKALNEGKLEAEDLVLLLGTPAPLLDSAVAARLQRFHTHDAIENVAVMEGPEAAQQTLAAANIASGHAARIKQARLSENAAELQR